MMMSPSPSRLASAIFSRGLRGNQRAAVVVVGGRSISSPASRNPTQPPSTATTATSETPQYVDERTLLSRLSPLKRVACLCPVPLGRGRVSWSGGDELYSHHDHGHSHHGHNRSDDNETISLDFRSRPLEAVDATLVRKYRYGERYAIGVAVSDPYLTRAEAAAMVDGQRYDDDDDDGGASSMQFTAEIVPTFRCDAHNFGSSSIFYTNLPYFRDDFLRQIGRSDIGAVVLALPMRQTLNPYCPTPTKVQLEQEARLNQVRDNLLGVLRNYASVDDGEVEEEEEGETGDGRADDAAEAEETVASRRRPPGPLDLRGCIDHRLSVSDVLSKSANDDYQSGNWKDIADVLERSSTRCQQRRAAATGPGGYNSGDNVFSSVPPEIHAAVALNAMMEKYTGGYHNSFF